MCTLASFPGPRFIQLHKGKAELFLRVAENSRGLGTRLSATHRQPDLIPMNVGCTAVYHTPYGTCNKHGTEICCSCTRCLSEPGQKSSHFHALSIRLLRNRFISVPNLVSLLCTIGSEGSTLMSALSSAAVCWKQGFCWLGSVWDSRYVCSP